MCVLSCFSALVSKNPTFPFYMLRNRSKRAAAKCSRQLLASWRATGEIPETACHSRASWLCGSPVGEPLACSFSKYLKFAFPCSFFSFVVALGFHRASNTCPPLLTQVRKRVEEFPCLKYTSIKLQISHN